MSSLGINAMTEGLNTIGLKLNHEPSSDTCFNAILASHLPGHPKSFEILHWDFALLWFSIKASILPKIAVCVVVFFKYEAI